MKTPKTLRVKLIIVSIHTQREVLKPPRRRMDSQLLWIWRFIKELIRTFIIEQSCELIKYAFSLLKALF